MHPVILWWDFQDDLHSLYHHCIAVNDIVHFVSLISQVYARCWSSSTDGWLLMLLRSRSGCELLYIVMMSSRWCDTSIQHKMMFEQLAHEYHGWQVLLGRKVFINKLDLCSNLQLWGLTSLECSETEVGYMGVVHVSDWWDQIKLVVSHKGTWSSVRKDGVLWVHQNFSSLMICFGLLIAFKLC